MATRKAVELAPSLPVLGAVLGAVAFLLVRLVPDVTGKSIFSDEAVAGLVGARPFPEVVRTAVWERGEAPLHFVLAHFALFFDPSVPALRWVSVVFAVAAVVVCFDLGRRLAGPLAGVTASVVAASSTLLGIYGSLGRMYALLAFVGALAADLFVRALDERTASSALEAAVAAWLLPASHTYGAVPVAAMTIVALVLWRGRPLRPALPVAAVALAMVPFLVADMRLASRFDLGTAVGKSRPVLSLHAMPGYFFDTFRSFAGGHGWTFIVLSLLGLAGVVALARTRVAFVAFAGLSPPASSSFFISRRRTCTRCAGRWDRRPAIGDRRPAGRAGPAGCLDRRERPQRRRALPVLVALPCRAPDNPSRDGADHAWPGRHRRRRLEARPRPRALVGHLRAARPAFPAQRGRVQSELGDSFEVHIFGPWLVVKAKGPFEDKQSMLQAGVRVVEAVKTASGGRVVVPRYRPPLCVGLRSLGAAC